MNKEEAKKKKQYIPWTPEDGFDLSSVVIPIGEYCPSNNEWEVRLDRESWFTCKTQVEAEILSRLIKLEREIKKLGGTIIWGSNISSKCQS